MTRYGETFILEPDMMGIITSYMNDELREDLHNELAPCKPEEFLRAYVERDAKFMKLLNDEFDIEID